MHGSGRLLFPSLILFTLLRAPAAALDLASLQPSGYINDYAGVLDPVTEADLERYATTVEKSTGAEIAVVTLRSLDGQPIEDVTYDLFRRWKIGKRGTDDGLLLLVSIGDRRTRLEVGRGLEGAIPDGMAGMMLDEMRPALRQQQYAEALGTALQFLGERIAAEKGVALTEQQRPRRRVPNNQPVEIPWPMLLFGLLLLFWFMGSGGRRGRRRGGGGGFIPGLILGHMMNRSMYGGYGRGGFGGYDSGDSFGGFGGGDTGGGGASSDW
jgi:uncharacterized protein